MKILGIETSCDETGIAIYDTKLGLIVNKLHSQSKMHSKYGGVVPELAAREHSLKIISLIKDALKEINGRNSNFIDAIAYTAGPGLVGSLLVGTSVATSLAYAWKIPRISINHMEGHLLSPMLNNCFIKFPVLALLVSGGHTQIVQCNEIGKYTILGNSLDDAVGEAFDKVSKLLGLGYPGGKKISDLAKNGKIRHFSFPRPMTNVPGLDFSFSGLKTFTSNVYFRSSKDYQAKADVAKAFEEAVIDTLIIKCKRAIELTGIRKLIIAGGVSANTKLKQEAKKMINFYKGSLYVPLKKYATDNAAMIAYVGSLRYRKFKDFSLDVSVNSNWSISELNSI
ncbi:tRNA (adenosine(37)-N6)-threonylcarbamoyltransferase complex transferase subunit TsaD [Buchnera aphidicola (Mindarus keteleerifoliae)]|uniref:tRNA (adenosine(37)-N6)-threonylcarbamoyltransferase complex transferase subunit TsaD n=1 Tax=Buchnera aphidicola TaxID=9 RepID=UPI0031B6FE44